MRPWISILGIYNHYSDVFDELTIPAASELRADLDLLTPEPLDRSLLISKILLDLGELPLIYTEPETLKAMIGVWSSVNHGNFLAMWETMLYKYNPIWNKDGRITEQRERESSGTTGKTGSGSVRDTGTIQDAGTETDDGTITDAGTTSGQMSQTTVLDGTQSSSGTNSQTVSHNVTGFDTNSYSPDTQDVTSGSGSETVNTDDETTVTGSTSGTSGNTRTIENDRTTGNTRTLNTTRTLSNTETGTSSGTDSEDVTRVEQGNIGVTTTQAMIREQREIVQFNLYEYITNSFKRQFCLMVY